MQSFAHHEVRCFEKGCIHVVYKRGRCYKHYQAAREPANSHLRYSRGTDHIYAIRGAAGLVKIGKSTDPKKRFRNLRNSSPEKLELVGFVELSGDAEFEIHDRLRKDRLHGEWFSPSEAVLKVVEMIAARQRDEILNWLAASP